MSFINDYMDNDKFSDYVNSEIMKSLDFAQIVYDLHPYKKGGVVGFSEKDTDDGLESRLLLSDGSECVIKGSYAADISYARQIERSQVQLTKGRYGRGSE